MVEPLPLLPTPAAEPETPWMDYAESFIGLKEIKGVLIDAMCGEKMMKKEDPQKAAADHPKACAVDSG